MTENLKIKIYADGANLKSMLSEYKKGIASGFTTNPSLMKKDGVVDYRSFAKEVLEDIKDMPISFEVFADDYENVIKEALEISSFGENVFVKIPVVDTKGNFNGRVIKELSDKKVKLNITAIFTMEQVNEILKVINKDSETIISIFAGRIADTGVNPVPMVKEAIEVFKDYKGVEILWASCRELYSIVEADSIGCHIITVQNNMLEKLDLFGKDLTQYSIDTVNDFFKDANSLGFSILK